MHYIQVPKWVVGRSGISCTWWHQLLPAQIFGGSPQQIEYAAEMGLEHHLGLTCDHCLRLVQIPLSAIHLERSVHSMPTSNPCFRTENTLSVSIKWWKPCAIPAHDYHHCISRNGRRRTGKIRKNGKRFSEYYWTKRTPQKREKYRVRVDVLRIVAIFMMIVSHCCDADLYLQFDTNRANFLTELWPAVPWERCVPLFAMLTGVLLLPVLTDMRKVSTKTYRSILVPLIFGQSGFTAAVLCLFQFYQSRYCQSFCRFGRTYVESRRVENRRIFNFNYDTIALVSLCVSDLYLIMPLVSPWIQKATQSELNFLMLWGVSW